jgi:alanine racemase
LYGEVLFCQVRCQFIKVMRRTERELLVYAGNMRKGVTTMDRFWRPAWVEIDTDAIGNNVREIRRHIGEKVQFIVVVKGDGYGHGAVEVGRVALANGADRLAVAMVDEALELRDHGITAPILVLGYTAPCQLAAAVDHDLTLALYTRQIAKELAAVAQEKGKVVKVHMKVNTGLNRIGVQPEDAVEFARFVKGLAGIELEGIFTHFAKAAQKDKTDTERQLRVFNQVLEELAAAGIDIPLRHAANSAATYDLPSTHFNAVRTGRIFYGYYPYPEAEKNLTLKPALQLKTIAVHAIPVAAGDGVGYDAFYRPAQDTRIITLPLGSSDGLSKRLAGKCPVLLKGQRKTIVATCADMCMVDAGDLEVKVGEEVVIFGKQGEASVSPEEVNPLLGVTLGEVLCCLSRRLPRVYTRNGKPYLVRTQSGRFIEVKE